MAHSIDLPQVTVTAGQTAASSVGVILEGRILEDDELCAQGVSARIASVSFGSGTTWNITLKDAWPGESAEAVAGYVRIKPSSARFTEDVTAFITMLDAQGVWLATSGVPSNDLGQDGQYAFDAQTMLFYEKKEGVWVEIGGAVGSVWHTGTGVPAGTLGKAGDFYLRTNGDVYSKGSGGWTLRLNIRGDRYDVAIWDPGKPGGGELVFKTVTPATLTFPQNLTGSIVKAGTAATATSVWSIRRNGVQVATMTFAAGQQNATFASSAAIAFAAGDILEIIAPNPADATLRDVFGVLSGSR